MNYSTSAIRQLRFIFFNGQFLDISGIDICPFSNKLIYLTYPEVLIRLLTIINRPSEQFQVGTIFSLLYQRTQISVYLSMDKSYARVLR